MMSQSLVHSCLITSGRQANHRATTSSTDGPGSIADAICELSSLLPHWQLFVSTSVNVEQRENALHIKVWLSGLFNQWPSILRLAVSPNRTFQHSCRREDLLVLGPFSSQL